MPRLLFEKKENAIWISHLDLMRMFQRAFKRAGLQLTHTKGFNPRPSVSIALPLSVGIESSCELLDFDLDGEAPANSEIRKRLNEALVAGVRVLDVYDDGKKIKYLSFLDCVLSLEYDGGIPQEAAYAIENLFSRNEVIVTKKSKSGSVEQNIIPMIRRLSVCEKNSTTLALSARIFCQNPTLNPMQIAAAIEKYLPHMCPDFVTCSRVEVYDEQEQIFR